MIEGMVSLVRARPVSDADIRDLKGLITELARALDARVAEVGRVDGELAVFASRYRREVGRLSDELDELEYAIAEAELRELSKELGDADAEPHPARPASRPAPPPRLTSDAVRKLFRDVAKAIHPDLAHEDAAHERRHALMVEANQAYALGDTRRLRAILADWQGSGTEVDDLDPEVFRLQLLRRLGGLNDDLQACTKELALLHASSLWKLKVMVDDSATRGKDLIAEMVRDLRRDIVAATNRLDAMRSYG